MRRVERPTHEPEALRCFREEHPRGTWKEKKGSGQPSFKCLPENVEVFDDLARVQRHLCAYCEIDISRPLWGQVEHFVPEHLSSEVHNFALDFSNMLACCDGGIRRDISNGRAVDPIPETQHCGQLKGDQDPRGKILDPRELPQAPCLWSFDRFGKMSVNASACTSAGIPSKLAESTLDYLGLDRGGLRGMRAKLREALEDEYTLCLEDDPEISAHHAKLRVAREQLALDQGKPPRFWSCIRHWAGEAAEEILGYASPPLQAPERP